MHHRYSQTPNTPSPFPRTCSSSELRIGSVVVLPKLGRAVLKFIGSVEGKNGKYAGVELLGDAASQGKNSGDVNGVQYFQTKQEGAGLFMSYDKFVSSIEYVESPINKRLSLLSPKGVKFNQTPVRASMAGSIAPPVLSSLNSSRRSTIASTITTANSKPPSLSLEQELQKLKSSKTVIESERNDLIIQNQVLKEEVVSLKLKNETNEQLVHQLELKYEESRLNLDKANEKLVLLDAKLLKQKKNYEEQRDELLEVIDQVEQRVNENEKIYLTELKNLQEQLLEKHNNDDTTSSDYLKLQDELVALKNENHRQTNTIKQLQRQIDENEEKMALFRRESHSLKEDHIEDLEKTGKTLHDQLEQNKLELEKKNNDILQLKAELSTLKGQKNECDDHATIQDLNKKIKDLESSTSKTSEYEKTATKLNKEIAILEKKIANIKPEDAVFELEYKLANKEKIIEELKQELLLNEEPGPHVIDDSSEVAELKLKLNELQTKINLTLSNDSMQKSSKSNSKANCTDSDVANLNDTIAKKELEVKALNEELQAYKTQQAASDSSLTDLKDQLEEYKTLQMELNDVRKTMKEQNAELEKLNAGDYRLKQIELSKLQIMVSEKDLELRKLQTELSSINQTSPNEKQRQDELVENLRTDKTKLEDELALTKTELLVLQTQTTDTAPSELLEEKNLEIELLKEELETQKSTQRTDLGTTNSELHIQIELLKDELKTRPLASQLQELRSEIELISELRKAEVQSKDKEISTLQDKLKALGTGLSFSPEKQLSPTTLSNKTDNHNFRNSITTQSSSTSPFNGHRPSVLSQVVDGELQVYVPETKDPASGRELWCGLCERDGHDSIDCPFENDIF